MVEMLFFGDFGNLKSAVRPEEIIAWCEENCEGLVYLNKLSYKMEFELEGDALVFKLRWS